MNNYFGHCNRIIEAYSEGLTYGTKESTDSLYKTHRQVKDSSKSVEHTELVAQLEADYERHLAPKRSKNTSRKQITGFQGMGPLYAVVYPNEKRVFSGYKMESAKSTIGQQKMSNGWPREQTKRLLLSTIMTRQPWALGSIRMGISDFDFIFSFSTLPLRPLFPCDRS